MIDEIERGGKKGKKKYSASRNVNLDWQAVFSDSDNEPVRDRPDDDQQARQKHPPSHYSRKSRSKSAVGTRNAYRSDGDRSDSSVKQETSRKRKGQSEAGRGRSDDVGHEDRHRSRHGEKRASEDHPDHPNARHTRKVAFVLNADDDLDHSRQPNAASHDEEVSKNIPSEERTVKLQDSVNALDEKVAKMEDNMQRSLYNIEVLLRNAVFYRGQTQGHVYQTKSDPKI